MADEVKFGDTNVEFLTLDKYRGRKGVTDRIALVSSGMLRGISHFAGGDAKGKGGKMFICFTQKGQPPAFCCVEKGQPKQYFALPVFHYVTDNEGNILVPEKCQGQLKVWRIPENRYKELSALASKWAILDSGFAAKQYDILTTTTDEDFQKMTFVPCPEAHWKSREGWYTHLSQKAKGARAAVADSLGQKLTEQAVRVLFGFKVPATDSPNAASLPATDIKLDDLV